jgi:hypothetical protein
MRKLYFTVLGPIPNGFGIVSIHSTHAEAWEAVKDTNDHFIGALTQEEAEQRGLITLAEVRPDPFKRRAA